MIDLHLHTNASDGEHAPADLVRLAHEAGLRLISVTDHDTVAGLADASRAAAALGLGFVSGIEISTVLDGRDVHVLAYGFDPAAPRLLEFLRAQRDDRKRRVVEMGERLASLGVPVDVEPILQAAVGAGECSVGRPQVALALVEAGHVPSVIEAFEQYLFEGGPAYVPRCTVSPAEAVTLVSRAGGVTCLAHPGLLGRDDVIPGLAGAGLFGLEAWHTDHDAATTARYVALAARLDLAVSGGSDFHGAGRHRNLGEVTLPEALYRDLVTRAADRGVANLPAWPVRL